MDHVLAAVLEPVGAAESTARPGTRVDSKIMSRTVEFLRHGGAVLGRGPGKCEASLTLSLLELPPIIHTVTSQFLVFIGLGLFVAGVSARQTLPADAKADRVIVSKKEHTLTLMSQGKVLKTYRIALGRDPVGPKARQGDHKTPEGIYLLDRRNAHSRFYRAIHISYPDAKDRAEAAKLGVNPGGDVMIHGLPNGFGWMGSLHRSMDWTDGCIAVTDEEIDEIWRAVPDGTEIEIRP